MLLMVVLGVLLIVYMFENYSALILRNTDHQLISLARSVDVSAESQLERYTENLAHTMQHEECREAEEAWRADRSNTEVFRATLANSLLGRDEKIEDIIIIVDEQICLSQSRALDYQLLDSEHMETEIEVRPCISADGTIYMAIIRNSEGRASYGILVNLVSFYERITENLSAELQNEIIMMDADAKALVHRKENEVVVDKVTDFTEEDSKYSMLQFLVTRQQLGDEGTDFCDAVSSATGRAYTARMAVVPATKENNGVMAIGVSTDYDEMTRPMRAGTVQLILYGGMAFIGIASLVIMLLYTFRGNQRAMREIALLQEKNTAMEELNRQTEELAHHQRLELMGTLTSGIAHEFNNLLAPIMGYSILILEKLSPEETEIYDEVIEIYNTSQKAKIVVSRLQDLARKHAGDDMKELVLDEVVQKAVEIAKPAKPKPVSIELHLNGQQQCVMGNETQISQLLLNLLINAFHATEENAGTIVVTTEVQEQKLLLKVADNGYGMSNETIGRMFEPFFTTKKGGQGTGLGLAIAKEVVEEHHGTIKVESKEGEGTVFFVEFPVFSYKS